MGGFEEYKPIMVVIAMQFMSAGVTLSSRTALLHGMSPRVFVVYRQTIAFLAVAPFAFIRRRKEISPGLGLRSFSLIFLASLIGVTMRNNFFFQGLYLTSSSIASAMDNLSPAITFVLATIFGMEKIQRENLRSIAKITGTLLCVCGAAFMAFLKGPKLLNSEYLPQNQSILLDTEGDKWLLGCFLLFGASWCFSLMLILQVTVTASHPDHLSCSAWMSFFGALQSATVTFFLEPNLDSWHLHSYVEIGSCLYSGAIGSGIVYALQAWCVSRRGPLFVALFNPLCTVIVSVLASLGLHEEIYTGSLIGALGVIVGLYIVLWGKAKDYEDLKVKEDPKLQREDTQNVDNFIGESSETMLSCQINLEEPLLSHKSMAV